MNRLRWIFLLFLTALSAFRFWYASQHGLVYDEAYYWLWARRLAPGYYDQGPGVAVAIRFGLLFGHSTAAVRLVGVLDAAVTSLVGYALAARVFRREEAGFAAGIFLNVVPLLFIGGLLMTHDSPQVASWSLALYTLARALGIGDPGERPLSPAGSRLGWWLLTGLFAGASMDSKYTAVLFLPCAASTLLLTVPGRAALRTPGPYAALALALLIFVPPVYWNAAHQWPSARHILGLGGAQHKRLLDLPAVSDYLGGQLGVTLLFFFPMAWAACAALRRGLRRQDDGLTLLGIFSAPIWVLFLLLSFHGQVEANWPVPAYFAAVVAAPWMAWEGLTHAAPLRRRLLGSYYIAAVFLTAVLLPLLLFPELAGSAPGLLRKLKPLLARTNEMYGWDQLTAAIERAGWTESGDWQIATSRYQEAAELSFNLPGQPQTYNLPVKRRRNQFDLWEPLPDGSRALVVLQSKETAELLPQIRQLFAQVGSPETVELWRRSVSDAPIASYTILPCVGYRGGKTGLLENQW